MKHDLFPAKLEGYRDRDVLHCAIPELVQRGLFWKRISWFAARGGAFGVSTEGVPQLSPTANSFEFSTS